MADITKLIDEYTALYLVEDTTTNELSLTTLPDNDIKAVNAGKEDITISNTPKIPLPVTEKHVVTLTDSEFELLSTFISTSSQ